TCDPDATGAYVDQTTFPDTPPRSGDVLEETRDSEGLSSLGSFPPWSGPSSGVSSGLGGQRYRTLRPHAKGGLGEVFVAFDEELGREVALKEIQAKYADRLDSRSRFLLEAEVTGGLEHPGIVPVYGLGRYPDGRPYYAMRFIRGRSLTEAINAFHSSLGPGQSLRAREVDLRQLLGRFIDVCDAMAYAHSRGILHRDIKPDNIMLGSFGETLLVDWGLAKALDRPDSEEIEGLAPLRPLSSSGNSETHYGSTIGTPHYMSPEQADGRLDALGPASDVYSLGATLYCLLVGRTPFREKSVTALLAKVKSGDFPSPREANRGVPAALSALCVKAMANRPEDRYPTSRALAADVEHWLADEPVTAYREPFPTRCARWAKRHKTLVTTSVALMVLATSALAIGAVLINREKRRTEANFQLARAAVDQMLTQLGQVDLADIPQMEPVRKRMLGEALAFYQTFLKTHGDDRTIRRETARANLRLGDIEEMLGDYDDAERAYVRAVGLLVPLNASQPNAIDLRRDLARTRHNLGILLRKSNRFREAEASFRDALRIRKGLIAEAGATADDRASEKNTVYHLGALLARLGASRQEVETAYREAIDEQKALAADDPSRPQHRSELARYLNNQGILLARNEPQSAEKVYREALGIQEELAQRSPTVTAFQWQLARTLSNLGTPLEFDKQFDQAADTYREALDRLKRLADDYPTVPDYQSELAVVSSNLAMALRRIKKGNPESEQLLRSALRIGTTLLARFPHRPDYRWKSALTRRSLGILLADSGHKAEAESSFRASLETFRELVRDHPEVPEYRSELGLSLDNLSLLLDAQGKVLDASRLVEEAIIHQRAAMRSGMRNVYFRQYLLTDYQYLERMAGFLRDATQCASAGANLARDLPDDPAANFQAARLFARAATLDGRLAVDQQKRRSEPAADRAVALLKKAGAQGFNSAKSLEDPVFDVIRDRRDFQQIGSSLGANPRPA
ncbi:protein kinase domain-containing protein, partial [Singulisphaera rosea]